MASMFSMVKCFVFTKIQEHKRDVSQRIILYCAWPYSKIPRAYIVILLLELASKFHTAHFPTF